jgi:hypothetical protein
MNKIYNFRKLVNILILIIILEIKLKYFKIFYTSLLLNMINIKK